MLHPNLKFLRSLFERIKRFCIADTCGEYLEPVPFSAGSR